MQRTPDSSHTPRVGIYGIPYTRNPYPGKFVVVEGPDRVGKSTLVTRLAAALEEETSEPWHTLAATDGIGTVPGLLELREFLLHSGECLRQPVLFEYVTSAACCLTQTELLLPKLAMGINVLMDRWFPSAFVYGQQQGLDLSFLIALKQPLLVPDTLLIISRDRCLPRRGNKQDAWDANEQQHAIRRLYEWLLGWWRENVPTCPAGMLKLSVKDNREVSYHRARRRLYDLWGGKPR